MLQALVFASARTVGNRMIKKAIKPILSSGVTITKNDIPVNSLREELFCFNSAARYQQNVSCWDSFCLHLKLF